MKTLLSAGEGKLDQDRNSKLTLRREPNVAEEASALSVACTQIAGPVYAAALYGGNSR